MEPQEVYCFNNKEEKCCKIKCLNVIIAILLTAFSFVIGLIIGASLAGTFIEALAAIIVLAVVLGILLIIAIILKLCNDRKKKRNVINVARTK